MSEATNKAVFLSYASQDAEPARRICEALRAAGVEVWFDQSELCGGGAWEAKVRRQIKECTLFVPVISGNTQGRRETSADTERERCVIAPDGRQSFQWAPPKRTGLGTRLSVLTHVANSTKSRNGRRAGLGGAAVGRRAADSNCSFSTSLRRAMDGFQLGQSVFEMEQPQVVFEQRPIKREPLFARRLEQKSNIIPVAHGARGIVGQRLNLQTDDIFDPNDRQSQLAAGGQSLRPAQHTETGTAKGVQDVDPTPRSVLREVVRNVFRVELAPVATPGENPIRDHEIVAHQNEIEIHRGSLHAAQGHGESADRRIADTRRVELAADGGDDVREIHWRYAGKSLGERRAMATVGSGSRWAATRGQNE
jgi:hypothetical protein